jgi:predicted ATPase
VHDSLARFLDFTNRLTQTVRFAGVRLGVLYTMDENPEVLGLRAELVSESEAPDIDRFQAGGVGAFNAVDPSPQAMDALVQQLDTQHLLVFVESIHERPIALPFQGQKPPTRAEMLAEVKARRREPMRWSYQDEGSSRDMRGAFAHGHGQPIGELLSYDLRPVDRAIAVQSGYRLSSLRRLAVQYLGKELDPQDASWCELLAPWPLQALRAERKGRSLRIEIDALSGIERERLVLNVEAADGDMPLAADALRWTQVPGEGRVMHVGVCDDLALEPLRVNAYYRGLEEVWLRVELSRSFAEQQAATPARVRRHSPRGAEPEPDAVPSIVEASPATATPATLTRLHVERFRALRDVTLELTPLTVLVGPNQAGKSTILDAIDLLRSAADKDLYPGLVRRRGGFSRIAWRGEDPGSIHVAADLRPAAGPVLRYELVLAGAGAEDYLVAHERIYRQHGDDWQIALDVDRGRAEIRGRVFPAPDRHELFITQVPALFTLPEIETVRAALAPMAVYPHLSAAAAWASVETPGMRGPTRPEPGARLMPTGVNLVAALHSLREESPEQWELFIEITRRVFPELEDIRLPSAVRGYVQLSWKDRRFESSFDASDLSDGTLAFLASLCALMQPGASLVAIDEPERHLHPEALYRLLGAARLRSDSHPVVFATQSDRLLGFLDDIPESIVAVRQGDNGTELVRPDPESLQEWLEKFSLADMRHEIETWGQE